LRNQGELFRFVADFHNHFDGRGPFTLQTLAELHHLTIKGIYPCAGNFRDTATDRVEIDASFTPAEPYEIRIQLPDLLTRARNWQVAGDTNDLGRNITLATDLFYDLIVLHPFRGGNGRVSRAFLHLLLYDMNVLQPPEQIFSYMARRRFDYFQVLRRADSGDRNPFYSYVRRGVRDSAMQPVFDLIKADPLGHKCLSGLAGIDGSSTASIAIA